MPAYCFHSWFAGSLSSIACAVRFGSWLAKGLMSRKGRSWPCQQAGSCAKGALLLPCTPEAAGVPCGVSSTGSKDPTSSRRAGVLVRGVGCWRRDPLGFQGTV